MPGCSNRFKKKLLEWFFRERGSMPNHFYAALATSATAPNTDTKLFSELTEIAEGNGYDSGGMQLDPSPTDFNHILEDDENDLGEIGIKDLIWTASPSGPIPASGDGARYIVLLDDNPTISARQILGWGDLSEDRSVAANNDLVIKNFRLRLTEV